MTSDLVKTIANYSNYDPPLKKSGLTTDGFHDDISRGLETFPRASI